MVLLACLILPGCASILNTGNQSTEIRSTPPGATVYKDEKELGTTPYTYTLTNEDERIVGLSVRAEGWQPAFLQVRTRTSGLVAWVDALLLGIPAIFDTKNPASRKTVTKLIGVSLFKELPTDVQTLDLPIAPLEHEFQPNAVLGRRGGAKLKLSDRELNDLYYPRHGAGSVSRGLRNTFVNPIVIQPGTTKAEQDLQSAKVVLRPLVKQVDVIMGPGKGRTNGSVHLDIDWRFYSTVRKDSLLYAVGTTTDQSFEDVHPSEILGNALSSAARTMLDDDGLYERLAEARFKGLSLSRGGRVDLTKPKPIVFDDRKSMFPALVKAVVTVEMKNGHGSGFMITNDGYLLTNAHVVGTEPVATVRFEQGFALEGQVVKVNRDFDLALVKVPGTDMPALVLGDAEELALGEELFAIGTPLDERFGQSVSRGVMSGRREIDGRKYLQTDVSINPGNSGGPLVDDQGKVMGIATMKVKATGIEGMGFGVPINTALEMLNIEIQ